MITDGEIRDDVTDELRWDPKLADPNGIGVAVTDGAVTLTGHALSYAEKMAAARAAERVYGVSAVANDLRVEQADSPRDDCDIATAIAHGLDWNVQIPENAVHARVEDGWVTLDGEVEHNYQRREVELMVARSGSAWRDECHHRQTAGHPGAGRARDRGCLQARGAG